MRAIDEFGIVNSPRLKTCALKCRHNVISGIVWLFDDFDFLHFGRLLLFDWRVLFLLLEFNLQETTMVMRCVI